MELTQPSRTTERGLKKKVCRLLQIPNPLNSGSPAHCESASRRMRASGSRHIIAQGRRDHAGGILFLSTPRRDWSVIRKKKRKDGNP